MYTQLYLCNISIRYNTELISEGMCVTTVSLYSYETANSDLFYFNPISNATFRFSETSLSNSCIMCRLILKLYKELKKTSSGPAISKEHWSEHDGGDELKVRLIEGCQWNKSILEQLDGFCWRTNNPNKSILKQLVWFCWGTNQMVR